MNLTTQLRIILLLAGGGLLLLIYLLGRRHQTTARDQELDAAVDHPRRGVHDFGPSPELDEAALETPAYMRRQGGKAQPLFDADDMDADDGDDELQGPPVRIGHADSYIDVPVMASQAAKWDTPNSAATMIQPMSPSVKAPAFEVEASFDVEPDNESDIRLETASSDDASDDVIDDTSELDHRAIVEPQVFGRDKFDMVFNGGADEMATAVARDVNDHVDVASQGATEDYLVEPDVQPSMANELAYPTAEQSTEFAAEVEAMSFVVQPLPVTRDAQSVVVAKEPPTVPSINHNTEVQAPEVIAPMLSEVVLPPSAPPTKPESAKKPAASLNKRKIIALRLSAPARIAGSLLLDLLRKENLHHGRFDIFHRMHGDASVFSVASMVEPGSFDLRTMSEQQFPGVTLFMLLPGPLDGLVAYDQMLSCAQRVANTTQAILQDERGHKLTSAAEERLREEVLNFQHLLGNSAEPIA